MWPSDDDDDALIAMVEQVERAMKKIKIGLVVIHNRYVGWTRFRFLWAPMDDVVSEKMDEFDVLSGMMWENPAEPPKGYAAAAIALTGSLAHWSTCGYDGKFKVPVGHVVERVATVEIRYDDTSSDDDV